MASTDKPYLGLIGGWLTFWIMVSFEGPQHYLILKRDLTIRTSGGMLY